MKPEVSVEELTARDIRRKEKAVQAQRLYRERIKKGITSK